MKTLTELNMQNLYERLEIQPDADNETIKKAYKKTLLKYHPDKNPGVDTTAQCLCIQESYELLQDADYKANYDALLNNAKDVNITSICSNKTKLESINLVCNTMSLYKIDYKHTFFTYLTNKKINEHLKIIEVLKLLHDFNLSKKDIYNALNNMDLLIRGAAYDIIKKIQSDELNHSKTYTNKNFLVKIIRKPLNATEIDQSRNEFIEQNKNPSFSHALLNTSPFDFDNIDISSYQTVSEIAVDCLAKPVLTPVCCAVVGVAGIGVSLFGAIASTNVLIHDNGRMDNTRFSFSAALFINSLTTLAMSPVLPVLCVGQAVARSVSTLNAAMSDESANESSTELTLLNLDLASESESESDENNVHFSL